jgi:parvulin-like peptidyl-prolyl isomerase
VRNVSRRALILVVLGFAGCERAPRTAGEVLVTVNGVGITEAELHRREQGAPHRREEILESMIKDELAAQKASELGLDSDPKYQETLRELQANLDEYRRKTLSELYYRKTISEAKAVTEAEARRWFDDNRSRIRTELHLLQILKRDEAAIEEARRSLEEGRAFDEVAGAYFPNHGDERPWDLGHLSWQQIPEPWKNVVHRLRPGEVSGVIRGPNRRFWIIQLVGTRESATVDFDVAKPAIIQLLEQSKAQTAKERIDRELLEGGRITRVDRMDHERGESGEGVSR